MAGPDFRFEAAALERGAGPVCGIDEAGRGPLAGPVVAAAVILDPALVPAGLNDSKKLSAARREVLFETLLSRAVVGIGIAEVDRIDRDNILQATLWAMGEAVRALSIAPALALVDGNRAPVLPCRCQTIVAGDAICASIAAASIIAKVTRDRLMARLDVAFPNYGFAAHKGYGTSAHLAALAAHGPSPQHRMSFAPVAEAAAGRSR